MIHFINTHKKEVFFTLLRSFYAVLISCILKLILNK